MRAFDGVYRVQDLIEDVRGSPERRVTRFFEGQYHTIDLSNDTNIRTTIPDAVEEPYFNTLIDMIRMTSSVHTLIIRNIGLKKTKHVVVIARAMKHNTSITRFEFGTIIADRRGIHEIANMIRYNEFVRHLELFQSHNLFRGLVRAIGQTRSLESLHIGQDNVNSDEDRAIRAMLVLNTSITELYIAGAGEYHDNKFIRLWQAMQCNTVLARFSLPAKQLRKNRYLEHVFQCLQNNHTFQYIGLERNLLTVDDIPRGSRWPVHLALVLNVGQNRLHRQHECYDHLMQKLHESVEKRLTFVLIGPREPKPYFSPNVDYIVHGRFECCAVMSFGT